MSDPIWVTKAAASILLSCSIRHVDNLEKRGLIKPIRDGRFVRYSVDDLRALRTKLAEGSK
jgi:DNA-binding transcriptional MerR regulator